MSENSSLPYFSSDWVVLSMKLALDTFYNHCMSSSAQLPWMFLDILGSGRSESGVHLEDLCVAPFGLDWNENAYIE